MKQSLAGLAQIYRAKPKRLRFAIGLLALAVLLNIVGMGASIMAGSFDTMHLALFPLWLLIFFLSSKDQA